jgi:hypothetical protein
MKTVSAVLALILAITVFVLSYAPIEIALIVYAAIGIIIGAFWGKAKSWAKQGIYGLIGGLILCYFLDKILPVLTSSVQTNNWVEIHLFKYLPSIIKALLVWLAVNNLMKRFRRTARAF